MAPQSSTAVVEAEAINNDFFFLPFLGVLAKSSWVGFRSASCSVVASGVRVWRYKGWGALLY